jgi:hypothetical protein
MEQQMPARHLAVSSALARRNNAELRAMEIRMTVRALGTALEV